MQFNYCSQKSVFDSRYLTGSFILWFIVLALTYSLLGTQALAQTSVPPAFFGMHMHAGVVSRQPWPVVPFGSTRLWDSHVDWAEVNPAKGVYNWSYLDTWLAEAKLHNIDALYTFGRTPTWASSNRFDLNCGGGVGQCAPPNDLNADGTGTDQHWKDFVTALVTHNNKSTTARISFWELWNEPYNTYNWTGTIAQLVRMSKDARTIIKALSPSALILTPSVDIESTPGRNWFASYLAAQGGQYSDMIAFHGYVQKAGYTPKAEDLIGYVDQFRTILNAHGQGSKALWDVEASWGRTVKTNFYDQDLQASFLARMYLLHRYKGISRFYWYQWNSPLVGTLWLPDPKNPSAPGTLKKPGIAFGQVNKWMVGATLTACSSKNTIWTCQLTRPGGYLAEAIWDTAQTCANGSCTTVGRTVDVKYKRYRTLAGTTITIQGSMVPVGIKPILLEN